jgi:DtxR family Mn-dependent transcriptional regulator
VVERRVYEALGRPLTCPHGNPIPGHSKAAPRERRLATLSTGARAAVSRVSEVAEREAPPLLAYLAERKLTPGRAIKVLEVDGVARTIRVSAGKREVTLSHDTAAKLWVVPT